MYSYFHSIKMIPCWPPRPLSALVHAAPRPLSFHLCSGGQGLGPLQPLRSLPVQDGPLQATTSPSSSSNNTSSQWLSTKHICNIALPKPKPPIMIWLCHGVSRPLWRAYTIAAAYWGRNRRSYYTHYILIDTNPFCRQGVYKTGKAGQNLSTMYFWSA